MSPTFIIPLVRHPSFRYPLFVIPPVRHYPGSSSPRFVILDHDRGSRVTLVPKREPPERIRKPYAQKVLRRATTLCCCAGSSIVVEDDERDEGDGRQDGVVANNGTSFESDGTELRMIYEYVALFLRQVSDDTLVYKQFPMPLPLPDGAKEVFQGTIFKIYQWPQTLYDGSVATFERCVRPDCVVVIAFLDHETVLLTKQEQPHKHKAFFDFPGGRIEENEAPEAAARREFLEETGYEIGRLESWFSEVNGSAVSYTQHFFFARDLTLAPTGTHLDSGERITVLPIKRDEIRGYALRNELRNRTTALAWLRLGEDPDQLAKLADFLR